MCLSEDDFRLVVFPPFCVSVFPSGVTIRWQESFIVPAAAADSGVRGGEISRRFNLPFAWLPSPSCGLSQHDLHFSRMETMSLGSDASPGLWRFFSVK